MSSTAPATAAPPETEPTEAAVEKRHDDRATGHAHGGGSSVVRVRRPVLSRGLVQGVSTRLARSVRLATAVAVTLVALGILFIVLDANVHKWLVSDVEDAARWLASPFQNTFMLHSAKLALALNWAIAILVYAVLGRLAAKLVQSLPARIWHGG